MDNNSTANKEGPKLTEPVDKEKQKKPLRRKVALVIDWVIIAFVLIGFMPVTILLVRNFGYGEVFYVNGMSMYPCLNQNAYCKALGRNFTWNDGGRFLQDGDLVDYGWGKAAKDDEFYSALSRFDVVMCYYPSDYPAGTSDFDISHVRSGTYPKIKRVIAFPGETVTMSYDPEELNNGIYGYSVWGLTSITDKNGETFNLDNLYSIEDYPEIVNDNGTTVSYLSSGNPVDGAGEKAVSKKWTLKENQYFVCGDNRRGNRSNDSRSVGALSKKMIFAKACLVTGRREIKMEGNGETVSFRLDQIRMPWDYKNLEDHK